ncbi:MAG: CHAT domain-containing protein [Acidobacteriaceae bacterium]|nr:CHAT domain-containing protein [Acidobacteriaceae bacterium]
MAVELYHQGQFGAAEKEAEAGCKRFEKGPEQEWFWNFKLLRAEIDLFGARGNAQQLLAAAPPAEYRLPSATYKILRGWQLSRAQHSDDAEKMALAGIAEAQAIGAYETEADGEILLASWLVYLDLSKADDVAQRALALATAHHLEYERGAALVNLGMVRLKREHYGDALPYFEDALASAKRKGAKRLEIAATQDLADSYSGLGDIERALKMQLQVVAANEQKGGVATQASVAYFELGNLYLESGDARRAITAYQAALKSVPQKNDSSQFAQSASGLAQALAMVGELDRAAYYNTKAFEACNRGDAEQVAFLTLNEADLAARRNQDAQAIRRYGDALAAGENVPSARWEAYAGLGREYAKARNVKLASSNFEQALGVIEQNRADQLTSRYQIAFLSNLIRVYQEYVSILMKEGQAEKAIEVADSSRASVLAQTINGRAPVRSGRLVRDAQSEAKLGRAVFLFYWLAPGHSYLWILTGDGVKTIELPDEAAVGEDVKTYLARVVDEKRDPLKAPNGAGERLYKELIRPAEAWIQRGTRVAIIPDGPLHNLNFEMLVNDEPAPHYWVEDAVISIAPSLSILTSASEGRRQKRESLLLIGDSEPVPEYPRLPQAAVELEDIEQHFPPSETTVYQGKAATVDSYRTADPKKFSSIHFAAHAQANQQSPLDSAIILSPGPGGYKLYARDVLDIPVTADLVTISGCSGAGTRAFSGEGLVGFAWAFFEAGARNVVTSLWDADDRRTAELMNRFYGRVRGGEPYATALREAKLEMLRSGTSKPYYWAPFQLYTRDAPRS